MTGTIAVMTPLSATTALSNHDETSSGNCIKTLPVLSKDIVDEIINSSVPYKDEEEKINCQRLVEELSIEDQEIAACTSYAYWVALNTHDEPPTAEIRIHMAMREARRHMVSNRGKFKKALITLRESIQYRKEYNIDIIRTCFPSNAITLRQERNNSGPCPELDKLRAQYRALIEDDLNKQLMVIRGEDHSKRAIIIKLARSASTDTTDCKGFLLAQLYITERAIATTEFLSRGVEEKAVMIFDFQKCNSDNSPPVKAIKQSSTVLQQTYYERLQTLMVIDPPFWMKTVWYMLSYILAKDTKDKVTLVYGKDKETVMEKHVNIENAMPFMLSKGALSSTIDLDQYLNMVPFHSKYDDVVTPAEGK